MICLLHHSYKGERETVSITILYSHCDLIILQEIAFFDVTRTGELLSRLSEDTQIIKNAATSNLSEALRNLATAFIGIGFMFATSWKLTRNLLLEFIHFIKTNMFLISLRLHVSFILQC